MDISSFKSARPNLDSVDRFVFANNSNISHTINGVEIQVRPSTSKCSLNYSNSGDIENDNLHLDYIVNETSKGKSNINNNTFLRANNQSYKHDISNIVKSEFIRNNEKMSPNNGNISCIKSHSGHHSIVDNKNSDYKNQSLCKKLSDSFVQNINTNLSLIKREINHKPESVTVLTIPLSDLNKSCSSSHTNSHRITSQPLDKTLHTHMRVSENQGIFPESLTLKKLELAARAEQLRIAEEIVQKEEEKAEAKAWQAVQEQEATLKEKERILEVRSQAAKRKYDEALRSIEEDRCKRLKLNKLIIDNDASNSLDNSHISDVSISTSYCDQIKKYNKITDNGNDSKEYSYSPEKQRTLHVQPHNHSEKFERKAVTCKIMPYNILSDPARKTGVRKPKKKVLALDMCKVEPRLELSSLKHTYSRKSPKKRFEDTKSEYFSSNLCQPLNFKLSESNIDLPGSRTIKEQILKSDSGTITITQLPKFDQPLRPFSAFPRLSSLCSTKTSEVQHSFSQVVNRLENCPSRISIDCSPTSSSSDISVSMAEKVEKLTSELQLHSLTIDKEHGTYVCVSEHEIKPNINEFSQNVADYPKMRSMKSDEIKCSRDYDNSGVSKEMFFQIVPHCYTVNNVPQNYELDTEYSLSGSFQNSETNLSVSNEKACYKISTNFCDSFSSKSTGKIPLRDRNCSAQSVQYQSENLESFSNNFEVNSKNSEHTVQPLIVTSKMNFLENEEKKKGISNDELDLINSNTNGKLNEGVHAVMMTQVSKNSFSNHDMDVENTTIPLKHENQSISHFLINDIQRPNVNLLTNKNTQSEIISKNCVQMVKVLPYSQFISSINDNKHNIEYENQIDTSIHSPEAGFIQIKYHTSNNSLQAIQGHLLSNDEHITTEFQEDELDCFEKKKVISGISSSDIQNVSETHSSEFGNETEVNKMSSEIDISSDKRFLNVNNLEVQSKSCVEKLPESHAMEYEDQTYPLDLGVDKELNQVSISNSSCAENIKIENNCFSKMEVASPSASFNTPCCVSVVSSDQDVYLSSVIYTSQSQELNSSNAILNSSNFNKMCPNELIYSSNHSEGDVKHLHLNFTNLQSNGEEFTEKQVSSDFSQVKTLDISENLKEMTMNCSSNKSNSFRNSDLDLSTETLDNSALFSTDGEKSFNLLSSTFVENCEESNTTHLPSRSFQEACSPRSGQAPKSTNDYTDIKQNSYICNNNNINNSNNNIEKIMSSGGRIPKLKKWWPNVAADAEIISSEVKNDKVKPNFEISLSDNDSNSLKECNIQPRKKRGRKKALTKIMTVDCKSEGGSPHWKTCLWTANIIPSSKRNENSFECGKCLKVFSSIQTFKSHAYSSHNGLVRLKGESQEFDEAFMNEILNIVFKVKRKLLCSVCNKTFKSVLGYKYHNMRCGKSTSDLYSNCNICNKRLLSVSIEAHIRKHDKKLSLKAEKKSVEIERNSTKTNNNDLQESVGRTPRKAAKSCHDQMKLLYESIDAECDDPDDKDFNGDETDQYFCSNKFKPEVNSDKYNAFNTNILMYGKSTCLNEGCDSVFKDIKQLKLHLRTCLKNANTNYVTCKLCNATVKNININDHLEKCHKDNISDDSDDISDEDELDSVIDSSKTSRLLPIQFKPYHHSKEMTENFRKINYSESLYTSLQCHSLEWIEIEDDELHLYRSRLSRSPLFSMRRSSLEEEGFSWERLQNLEGKVLGTGEILFAGGPIRSSAWCPIPHKKLPYKEPSSQYVALSCINSPDHAYSINKLKKHNGLIQIWHCGNLVKSEIPEFSLGIAHENGVVWSMDWCPSGIYEDPSNNLLDNSALKRLGLLAAAFSDGIIRVYLIPHPHQIVSKNKIFKKIPEFSLCPYDYENLELQCVKVCWCSSKNHSLIAGSFTNGMVCIWNLNCTSSMLRVQDSKGSTKLYPINSISAHNGICSTVSFSPKTDGRHIVTGGNDRTIKFWDLTQPEHPLTVIKKGIVTDSVWLPHWAGAFFSFDDAYSLGKTTTTYRENGFYGSTFRSILGTNASVWSIAGSDWLNAIVQVDEAGEIILSLQHNLNCETSNEKHMSKKRFPLFSVKVEKLKSEKISSKELSQLDKEEILNRNIIRKEQKLDGHDINVCSPQHFIEQPLTYATSVEAYGIMFYDEDYQDLSKLNEISIRSKQCSELMEPGPITIYPLMGASSVSWNNNFGTHSWICVGFLSGLVRIVKIPRLER